MAFYCVLHLKEECDGCGACRQARREYGADALDGAAVAEEHAAAAEECAAVATDRGALARVRAHALLLRRLRACAGQSQRLIGQEEEAHRRMEDEALLAMEGLSAEKSAFCAAYYFGAMTMEETAAAIDRSERQCRRYRGEIERGRRREADASRRRVT